MIILTRILLRHPAQARARNKHKRLPFAGINTRRAQYAGVTTHTQTTTCNVKVSRSMQETRQTTHRQIKPPAESNLSPRETASQAANIRIRSSHLCVVAAAEFYALESRRWFLSVSLFLVNCDVFLGFFHW